MLVPQGPEVHLARRGQRENADIEVGYSFLMTGHIARGIFVTSPTPQRAVHLNK